MGIGEILGILFLGVIVAMDGILFYGAFQTKSWVLGTIATVIGVLIVWSLLAAWFPFFRVWIFS